jgi:hypothetical protein
VSVLACLCVCVWSSGLLKLPGKTQPGASDSLSFDRVGARIVVLCFEQAAVVHHSYNTRQLATARLCSL